MSVFSLRCLRNFREPISGSQNSQAKTRQLDPNLEGLIESKISKLGSNSSNDPEIKPLIKKVVKSFVEYLKKSENKTTTYDFKGNPGKVIVQNSITVSTEIVKLPSCLYKLLKLNSLGGQTYADKCEEIYSDSDEQEYKRSCFPVQSSKKKSKKAEKAIKLIDRVIDDANSDLTISFSNENEMHKLSVEDNKFKLSLSTATDTQVQNSDDKVLKNLKINNEPLYKKIKRIMGASGSSTSWEQNLEIKKVSDTEKYMINDKKSGLIFTLEEKTEDEGGGNYERRSDRRSVVSFKHSSSTATPSTRFSGSEYFDLNPSGQISMGPYPPSQRSLGSSPSQSPIVPDQLCFGGSASNQSPRHANADLGVQEADGRFSTRRDLSFQDSTLANRGASDPEKVSDARIERTAMVRRAQVNGEAYGYRSIATVDPDAMVSRQTRSSRSNIVNDGGYAGIPLYANEVAIPPLHQTPPPLGTGSHAGVAEIVKDPSGLSASEDKIGVLQLGTRMFNNAISPEKYSDDQISMGQDQVAQLWGSFTKKASQGRISEAGKAFIEVFSGTKNTTSTSSSPDNNITDHLI